MGNQIMNWKKSGISSKPSFLHGIILFFQNVISKIFTIRCILFSSIFFGIFLTLGNVYLYLDYLYIVDQVYDINGPNELKTIDQFSIRVYAPSTVEELEKFLVHHSICPVVHEIQILWHSSLHDSPPVESFPYTTAHSKVSYLYFRDSERIFQDFFQTNTLNTNAVMFLDADVIVSCDDLAYTFSVWKSSEDAAVGYFPRMIRKIRDPSHRSRYEFLSAYNVALYNEYHILLSSAIMLKKQYVEALSKSSVVAHLLNSQPNCYHVMISVWFSYLRQDLHPIWIEPSDLKITPNVKLVRYPLSSKGSNLSRNKSTRSVPLSIFPLTKSSNEESSLCVNLFAKDSGIEHFRKSTLKSTKARDHWIW